MVADRDSFELHHVENGVLRCHKALAKERPENPSKGGYGERRSETIELKNLRMQPHDSRRQVEIRQEP